MQREGCTIVHPSSMHCRGMLMAYHIVYNACCNVGSAALAQHTGSKMRTLPLDHACHLNGAS